MVHSPFFYSFCFILEKGYLSGGFNDHAGPDHPTSFDQETLWSYEAGIKTRLLGNRIQLNSALFFMDIDDYQVRIDASPEHNYTANAAKAESYGFEA
jgi:iron complex outermembrane receptor protein